METVFRKPGSPQAVILYDGQCNLCDRSVQFIIRRDPKRRFRFAPIQSETAKRMLEESCLDNPGGPLDSDGAQTLVLFEGTDRFTKSDAALRIARRLSGFWPLVGGLAVVPRPLRDWLYDRVARNRLRWFGKKQTCPPPAPDSQDRYLK